MKRKRAISSILIFCLVLSVSLFQSLPISAKQVDSSNLNDSGSSVPSIRIISPSGGTTITGYNFNAKIPISAEVLNTNTVEKVEFYRSYGQDYKKIGEVIESPYSFKYDVSFIGQSWYNFSIYAKAILKDGSDLTSNTVSINIINPTPTPSSTLPPPVTPVPGKVPSVSIISPNDGATIIDYTRPIKVPISAEVLNADNVEKVEFYSGYTGKFGEVKESPYNLSYNAYVAGHFMSTDLYVKAILKDGTVLTSNQIFVNIIFPTPTITPEPKATVNPSQKPTPSPYISGRVVPDNSGMPVSGIKVEAVGTDLSYTTTSYQPGYFMFIDQRKILLPHTFKISKEGYLSREFTVNTPLYYYDNISLWPGDLDSDNCINMGDVMIQAKTFNTIEGDSDFKSICDFNLDKVINMSDVIIMAKHFNTTSSDYNK